MCVGVVSNERIVLIVLNVARLRSRRRSALPVKRLWQFLVKQEEVQETFIRNIFTKKRDQNEVFVLHTWSKECCASLK